MIAVGALGGSRASAIGRLALLTLSLGSSACSLFGNGTVDRRFHGRTVEGPFVSPSAYEAMVRGSVHEAKDELAEARRAYTLAAREAPDLAEPLARLGAVQCRLGEDAEPSFDRASKLDGDLATVWMERARCALQRKQVGDAAAYALGAMRRAPADPATSLLLHECLTAAHNDGGAARLRAAMRARWPDDPRVSTLAGDTASKQLAPRDALDEALRAGDERRAEQLAKSLRLPLASLALRAAALGRLALAARLALLVFRADPTSSDARIAVLVTADLQRDEAAFRDALGGTEMDKQTYLRPSPLGEALLAELLQRRTGVNVPRTPAEQDTDPLVASVWARLGSSAPKSR